jgi:hypothetical protein
VLNSNPGRFVLVILLSVASFSPAQVSVTFKPTLQALTNVPVCSLAGAPTATTAHHTAQSSQGRVYEDGRLEY